jgi:tRNA(Arg) A34 adenosine deaminase TadA
MGNLEQFMDIAIAEAKISLQQGNSGFGAVIIQDDTVIAKAHDTDTTSHDPTAHAELNAIRLAAQRSKDDLNGCMLVTTHEPCPMCSTAIVWSGITRIAFGYSIQDSLRQGRKRIDIPCTEIFARSGKSIKVLRGIQKKECGLLYNGLVRESIEQLREADSETLAKLAEELTQKRKDWFRNRNFQKISEDHLETGYSLFLEKLGITAEYAPIVERHKERIVLHSKNFCPTLEACKILGLDTRVICKKLTEKPMQTLLRELHPNLRFERNYNQIRPYAPYCEEMIILENPQ